MFLSTHRSNPFFDIDSYFNSFWDNDDKFFSTFMKPSQFSLSQEDRLNRQLEQLKNYEDEVVNNMKCYESEFERLKNTQHEIESKMKEIQEQINKIHEEKQKNLENSSPEQDKQGQKNESYVFKRSYYKTNDMEVEEQYDSRDPEKCYKMIKKQGQQPEIIYKQQEQQKQIKS